MTGPAEPAIGRDGARWAGWLVLAGLFADNVYRAATQAITHDEAVTFHQFVDGPWSRLYATYTANNHVLHSIFARLTVGAFGPSELALRLPSVVGGLVFLVLVHRILERVLGRGWTHVLVFTFVAANPFVLDYLSAARGYGLAAAAMLAALAGMLRGWPDETPTTRRMIAIAIAGGAAVAFNLAFLFPLAAMTLVWLAPELRRDGRLARLRTVLLAYLLPAAVLSGALVAPALLVGRHEGYDFRAASVHGAATWREFTDGAIDLALRHHPLATPWSSDGPAFSAVVSAIQRGLPPVLLGLFVVGAMLALVGGPRTAPTRALTFLSASVLTTLVVLTLSHHLFDLAYPKTRTGLHLVVLASLALGIAIGTARGFPGARPVRVVGRVILVAFVVAFATQLGARRYTDWSYDADSRALYSWFRDHRSDRPLRVLAIPFQHAPSLNFYRRLDRATWLDRVERLTPPPDASPEGWLDYLGRYDYLVLFPGVEGLEATRLATEPRHKSERSGTVIATVKTPPNGTGR